MEIFTEIPKHGCLCLQAVKKENEGFWLSKHGHKVLRIYEKESIPGFLEERADITLVLFDRDRLPEWWWQAFTTYLTGSVSLGIYSSASNILKASLPPWFSEKLSRKIPSEEIIYPEEEVSYPPINQIFSGLWIPFEEIKVIIIGQDPYHGENQAHGLAFSTKEDKIPPSLVNIYKELEREYGEEFTVPDHGDLTGWFSKGVMLINTSFTVLQGQPNSHQEQWDKFSKTLFSELAMKTGKKLVVLAWGSKAKIRADTFVRAKVLTSSHPSPFSARTPPTPFIGNNHFKLVNNFLRSVCVEPIDWNL